MTVASVIACVFVVVQGMWRLGYAQDLSYRILEGNETGRSLGNVAADYNLADIVGQQGFQNLRYSLLVISPEYTNLFHVDESSSLLTTAARIDRETICAFAITCHIMLNVAAQSTVDGFFKKITVRVDIDDVNDNAPFFERPEIDLSILESVLVDTSITIDGARDADTSDAFSLQSYEILPSNTPFEIHFQKKLDGTSVVRLLVKQELDREVKDSYQFQVIAKDGGSPPLSGTLQVNISIEDVNDNAPQFLNTSYNITVREDVNVSTVIKKIIASDRDSGRNGQIRFRLSPHQSDTVLNLFAINSITGDLSVKHPLMYVPGEHHSLIIEARDNGEQPLTSQLRVNVRIEDVTNSPPVINLNLLGGNGTAQVSEFANRGTPAAYIGVDDPDTGENGEVTCSIDNLYFELQRLDRNEYMVTVSSRELNREEFPRVTVTVSCTDNGSPSLSRNKTFTIDIMDENDNNPEFEMKLYTAGILENNVRGAVIIHVKANDADDNQKNNGRVRYSLPQSVSDTFSIEPTTGILRAMVPLDRETKSQYNIQVFAHDMGRPPLNGSANVSITVLDKNDNSPNFNQTHYEFEISENSSPGTKVGQLYATDDDEGENAVIVFSGPVDVPFTVFPEGVIKTDKLLDREVKARYDFTAEARDGVNTDIVHVSVFIKDKNDNSPVLTTPSQINNTVYISVDNKVSKVVTQVRAYDRDEGENADLTFKVIGRNDSERFALDENTGEITLMKSITSDNGKKFTLNVLVSDKGSPSRSVQGTLNIVVSSTVALTRGVSDSSQNNFIIVIVLVTVTIVASTAILFVIIFIRRKDNLEKSKKQREKYQTSNYDTSVTVFSLPSDDSNIFFDKKKKKEVSFSFENEDEDNMQVTSDPNQNTNKNADTTFDPDMQVSKKTEVQNVSSPPPEVKAEELKKSGSMSSLNGAVKPSKKVSKKDKDYNKDKTLKARTEQLSELALDMQSLKTFDADLKNYPPTQTNFPKISNSTEGRSSKPTISPPSSPGPASPTSSPTLSKASSSKSLNEKEKKSDVVPNGITMGQQSPNGMLRQSAPELNKSDNAPPVPIRSTSKSVSFRPRGQINSDDKKIDDSHSIGSTSDSGRGGSDDEIHSQRSPRTSGLKPGQRGWYEFQRPTNSDMLTFTTVPSRPVKTFTPQQRVVMDNRHGDLRYSTDDVNSFMHSANPHQLSSFREGSSESDRFIGGLNLSRDSISDHCVV